MKRKLQFSQIQSPSQIGFHGSSKEFENLLLSPQKCQKINEDIFVSKFFNILRFFIYFKSQTLHNLYRKLSRTRMNYRF